MEQPKAAIMAINWFESRFNHELKEINDLFDKFKISEALMAVYKLVWDDFCSWYLEMIKPGFQQPIDSLTLEATKNFFEKILKVIQPFTPFIAEELWHVIRKRELGNDIMMASWPELGDINTTILKQFDRSSEIITHIRNVRKHQNIANKVKLDLFVKKNGQSDSDFDPVIIKMGNLTQLEYTIDKIPNANSFIVQGDEYFVPFGDNIDLEAERIKLEDELTYTKGFLSSVQKKLENEKFVAGAPEQVIVNERKKEADALQKIVILEEKLSSLV